MEDVWLTLKPSRETQSIHINCAYIPGDMEASKFQMYTNSITSRVNDSPNDTFIISGDYNVPSFVSLRAQTSSEKAAMLSEFMELCDMEQFNTTRSNTSSNNLLDLIFSNRYLEVDACDDPISKVDDYHPPLIIKLITNLQKAPEEEIKFRNFKRLLGRV